MSKEDTPPGGLLSKVVKFVRNPTVNWSDLDALDTDRDSQYSKQVLKEMIERKRRNDFVRRREFDQLRKLRQREAQQGRRAETTQARATLFSSSMSPVEGREDTLKKIDEIEAQMSQQWWKGRDQGVVSTQAPTLDAPQRPAVAPPVVSAPAPMPAQAGRTAAVQWPHADQVRAYAPTAPLTLRPPPDSTLDVPLEPSEPLMADLLVAPPDAAPQPMAEDKPFVHDPDLEEAAIRFASGDYAGAEAGLREVLAQYPSDDPRQFEVWLTLFDLYRAIGRQEPFDILAIDYAARFGRSAPLWFSMPDLLGVDAPSGAGRPVAAQREFGWTAPPTLTQQSVAALQAGVARGVPPWTLDWSRLNGLEPAAVAALAQQFEEWADRDVQIRFTGAPVLLDLLQSHTPTGDRSADPQWWRLRLAALRLMGLNDEYELVALDYCVTYEVSPPSWVAPRCGYSGDGAMPSPAPEGPDSDLFMSGFVLTQPAAGADDRPMAALQGCIDGDALPALEPLEALAPQGDAPLIVSCERLIRMDFAAVGSALNWVAAQQALGRHVQFTQLHRLVAVLFNVIGINEHARVVPRRN